MRWEDERYVRLYTRDTAEWLALGWEAQSLLALTMRKLDRAGILELGRVGVRGLAAVVGMPTDVVERALGVLLADGCFVLNGTTLVMPNFIEAQEATQTDAQRKRESRARARDRARVSPEGAAVTKPDTGVTVPDKKSRNVARPDEPPHLTSQPVTPNRAVPSRAVPEKHAASPPPSLSRQASDLLVSVFREKTGTDYAWQGKKDGAALKALLAASRGDLAEIERRWRRALADDWKGAHDVAGFASQWNKLAKVLTADQVLARKLREEADRAAEPVRRGPAAEAVSGSTPGARDGDGRAGAAGGTALVHAPEARAPLPPKLESLLGARRGAGGVQDEAGVERRTEPGDPPEARSLRVTGDAPGEACSHVRG